MNAPHTSIRRRAAGFLLIVFIVWLLGALAGGALAALAGTIFNSARSAGELFTLGVRYGGGLGIYAGAQFATLRQLKREGPAEKAARLRRHIGGFHLTILGLCAFGALLGAIAFPLAGLLGGSHFSSAELITKGIKMGGFYFMVWAPGAALVREFWRAGQRSSRST